MGYKNLMLIDDDEDDQEIFMAALNEISAAVKCYRHTDATDALRSLALKEIIPEVIFLDLNMPGMNGLQFLAEIKKAAWLKDIPVIIFSTSSNPGTMQAAKELGAYDFITKPNNFDELINILKPIINQNRER